MTGFEAGPDSAGPRWAVRTAAGQVIPADVVVCCAGTQVPRLAELAGRWPSAPGLRRRFRWSRGPGRAPRPPGWWCRPGRPRLPGLTRMIHTPGVYLRPHAGGQVHLEAPDAAVDLHTPDRELRRWAGELLDRARRVTGGLDEATVTGYRVCVRPMPADGQSIVGWLPGVPGVYVAVTHSGVTLGAHLAALITAELLEARR